MGDHNLRVLGTTELLAVLVGLHLLEFVFSKAARVAQWAAGEH